MKTLASAAFASGLLFLQLLFSGCSPVGMTNDVGPLEFNPKSAEAWDLFDRAAARFLEPTGLVPVATGRGPTIDLTPRPDGVEECGHTTVSTYVGSGNVAGVSIVIYLPIPPGCFSDPADTLAHEMIHAMRGWARAEAHVHSDGGLFSPTSSDRRMTAETLGAVCEAVECVVYNPEE